MRLLLDENCAAKQLVTALRDSGHAAVTVYSAGLQGADDLKIWTWAQHHGDTIVTKNVSDFLELARTTPAHHGILAIFDHPDSRKNLSWVQIAKAVSNLIESGLQIEGSCHDLNSWYF